MSIIDKITGRAKKAAGDVADDPSLRRQGRRKRRKGNAKEEPGDAEENAAEERERVADLEQPDLSEDLVLVLSGRRAIVSGAATGIGRATALRLAADGAAVEVNYIGDPRPPTRWSPRSAAHAMAIGADVSRESRGRAYASARPRSSRRPIDLLVSNAGVEAP